MAELMIFEEAANYEYIRMTGVKIRGLGLEVASWNCETYRRGLDWGYYFCPQ